MSLPEKKTNHLKIKSSVENDFPFRIIIQFEKKDFEKLDLLPDATEWQHSGVKDYWYKVAINTKTSEQLYVHLAHEKHKKVKKTEDSNENESTYKEKNFNSDYKGFKKSKKIARNVLILPPTLILDKIDKLTGNQLLEKTEDFSENTSIFIFKAIRKIKKD